MARAARPRRSGPRSGTVLCRLVAGCSALTGLVLLDWSIIEGMEDWMVRGDMLGWMTAVGLVIGGSGGRNAEIRSEREQACWFTLRCGL